MVHERSIPFSAEAGGQAGRNVTKRDVGQRRDAVMELNTQAGRILTRSIGEARMLATQARASARGRGAQAKLGAARRLEELADHCQRIATQIQQR